MTDVAKQHLQDAISEIDRSFTVQPDFAEHLRLMAIGNALISIAASLESISNSLHNVDVTIEEQDERVKHHTDGLDF